MWEPAVALKFGKRKVVIINAWRWGRRMETNLGYERIELYYQAGKTQRSALSGQAVLCGRFL
jgi:hypothetical protein